MFRDEIKITKSGKRLKIDYFQGDVYVEVQNDRDAYEYLQRQAQTLATLRTNLLREAEKFNPNE